MVLHTLVSQDGDGMTASRVAAACERDPGDPVDTDEIDAALRSLLQDGLAQREGELYRPTRAAIRAAELSF